MRIFACSLPAPPIYSVSWLPFHRESGTVLSRMSSNADARTTDMSPWGPWGDPARCETRYITMHTVARPLPSPPPHVLHKVSAFSQGGRTRPVKYVEDHGFENYGHEHMEPMGRPSQVCKGNKSSPLASVRKCACFCACFSSRTLCGVLTLCVAAGRPA